MANTKISALTALSGVDVDAAADVMAIVDQSVTTTKKILVDELRYAMTGYKVLAKSGTAVSAGADTTEDTLATITVPAAAIGANGAIRFTLTFSMTNSANNKTVRVRFSGGAGTVIFTTVYTTTAAAYVTGIMNNQNSASSQLTSTFNTSAVGSIAQTNNTTSAIDTSMATTIVITGQKASSGETLTLNNYVAELISDGT